MALLEKNGLVSIHPLTLVPNSRLGANVYLWNSENDTAVKFLGEDQDVTEGVFGFLRSNPQQKLFVERTSYSSYQSYLFDNLDSWLRDNRVPSILKTTIVAECVHSQLSKAFAELSINALVTSGIECASRMFDFANKAKISGRELRSSLRRDDSFVTHAVNTAFYSLLIALIYCDDEQMVLDLCAGAILHDIGKLDRELFGSDQPSDLGSQKDWTERSIQTHPTDGFRRLCHVPLCVETHLMVCYQHHERIDGKGFPVGLYGDEIHNASKICAVANRYDGLTSNRANRPAMTKAAALRIMDTERNTQFESEVVRCLDRVLNNPSNN
jgi:HD-GYP domain-containing protein (c-di-GMP phosphodiesterase class II)